MSQEPAGFTLPPADLSAPPPAKKRGMPVWLIIVLAIVGLLLLGCLAIGALGAGLVLQSANPTAQAATAEASQMQLTADEELIVNGELLVEEPFDSADSIDVSPGDGSTATVEGGMYEASLTEQSFRSVYLNEPLTDFASEVECTVVSGGSEGACGIIFGVNETDDPNNNDQHFFFVSGGNYGMQTVNGGSNSSWSRSNGAVKSAEGEINLLRVLRQGSEVRLYVNDTLVDRFELTDLPEGGVGFAVRADEGDATLRLDNFRIWSING